MIHHHKSFITILLLIFTVSSLVQGRVPFACDPRNGFTRGYRFCNTNIPIHVRVQDLIGRLTLPEKIRLVVNNAIAVPRLGIQGYEWWSEALHGVSNVGPGTKFGGAFPGATSFPQVITTAASFNQSLWLEIGRVVSDEARAMYNGGAAGLTYWSPNVNIFRDPRWGRGQETPGEDPILAAKYAASYVQGLQGNGAGNRLKVAACCKHYTAYDLDNWNGVDRFHFNAKVSKQDLADTYDVPFKACVSEGNVASVMCSYNQVNGKPTCADPELLRNTIRGEWRLNGYIVSDCDSVGVFYDTQHYTRTPEEAAADAIKAGLDLDCGPFLALHTDGAIRQGLMSENDLNNALANLITVQMRLGMFDGEPSAQPYGNLGPRDVCLPAHNEVAVEAARQGIVLLQNKGNALPLSPTRFRNIGVIGPNSDVTVTMIGNYAGVACGYTTPLQGIARYARTIHQVGCRDVSCGGNQLFGEAEIVARQADATVLVMGLDQSIEAEFRDRVGLLLPGHQQELVSRVARAARGPVILVLMSGGPIDVTFAINDPKISAILWVGYPGQSGGTAIADVIFGRTNPGGRLPNTWYPQGYLSKVPMTNMDMRPNPAIGYPGRTYRFYKGPVVFPFGHGLSYSRYTHTLALAPKQVSVPYVSLQAQAFTNSSNKGIKPKRVKNDKLVDDLFGSSDVDLRAMPAIFDPEDSPLEKDKKPKSFDDVRAKLGKAVKPRSKDPLKKITQIDINEDSQEGKEANMMTILAQAQEMVENEAIGKDQYNNLIQTVIHLNETNKLKEAKRRESLNIVDQDDKYNSQPSSGLIRMRIPKKSKEAVTNDSDERTELKSILSSLDANVTDPKPNRVTEKVVAPTITKRRPSKWSPINPAWEEQNQPPVRQQWIPNQRPPPIQMPPQQPHEDDLEKLSLDVSNCEMKEQLMAEIAEEVLLANNKLAEEEQEKKRVFAEKMDELIQMQEAVMNVSDNAERLKLLETIKESMSQEWFTGY